MGPSADVIQFSTDEEHASADNAVSIYTHSTHNPLCYDLIVVECKNVNQSKHLPYCVVVKGPRSFCFLLSGFSKMKIGMNGL